MTLLEILRERNIPLRRSGKAWSSACPACGEGDDRFVVWPDKRRFWCRQCEISGDDIDLLRLLNPGMNYRQACEKLGIQPRERNSTPRAERKWEPVELESPHPFWWMKARAFVKWSHENLMKDPDRLAWLSSARGITEETARKFTLGWNPKEWATPGAEWGLEEPLKIPAGLVIPTRNRLETVVKVNIRRPEGEWRYSVIQGGSEMPLWAGSGKLGAVVLESDLDAILVSQEAGDLVTAVSTGGAGKRPDLETHRLLSDGRAVLVSMDSDEAGRKSAWGFWLGNYPSSIRWPVPGAKDPTEAWLNGLNVRAWVVEGLRAAYPVENPSPTTSNPTSTETALPALGTALKVSEPNQAIPATISETSQASIPGTPPFESWQEELCTTVRMTGYVADHLPAAQPVLSRLLDRVELLEQAGDLEDLHGAVLDLQAALVEFAIGAGLYERRTDGKPS